MKRKTYLASTCAFFCLFVGVSAKAQTVDSPATADPNPAVTAAQGSEHGLEEIVVTARKRTERLQDVPIAVKALTAKDLNRYSTGSITQLSTQVPSLMAAPSSNSAGGANIVLRGIGSPPTGPLIDQAVALNIDGVQISKAYAIRLGIYDLDRAEVLQGPQALFFGKNSPGGVISLISADPSDTLEAKVRAGYEFYARQKYIEGTVSGPLTDNLQARLDVYHSDEAGWFINDAKPLPAYAIPPALGGGFTQPTLGAAHPRGPQETNTFIRGTLKYSIPDKFDAKLKLSYTNTDEQDGVTSANQLYACPLGATVYILALNSAGSRDCKLDRNYNESRWPASFAKLTPLAGNGDPYVKDRQYLGSLALNFYPSEKLTISSVTGYWSLKSGFATNSSMGGEAYLLPIFQFRDNQFSQEVRVNSKFDFPVNFVVGAYYQHEKISSDADVVIDSLLTNLFSGFAVPPSPQLLFANTIHQSTNAWSVFGQGIADITNELQLTVGGRYSSETKRVAANVRPNLFSPTAYDVILTPDRRTFTNFSPEVSLRYKPSSNVTLYGSYRTGFLSGGFDLTGSTGSFGAINGGDTTYKQETVHGGEIGMKSTFANRQFRFDLSLYDFTYKGLQISSFDNARLSNGVTNAASARVKGVNVGLEARPDVVEGLTLRADLNYNRARYISFPGSPCYTGQTQANGCNLITSTDQQGKLVLIPAGPATVGNAQSLSGRPLTRAPEWSINLGETYDIKFNRGMTLSLSSDYTYTDSYQADADQDPRALAASAWRINASVELRGREDKWALALIGTNLTNVLRPLNSAASAATGGGTGTSSGTLADLQADYLKPRAVALQLTVKY